MKWSELAERNKWGDGNDWANVLAVANCDAKQNIEDADLTEVVAYSDGENDGAEWLAVVGHIDGRFVLLRAGCDYTGWG